MWPLGDVRALPTEPDASSPDDGGAEIRHILVSPPGDLTHAVCPANSTSGTHLLPELDEGYFVLAGTGEIWRATDEREAVTALRPGRWVALPAGMRFQYRANHGTALVFLVVVLPSWRPDLFHVVDGGRWVPGADGREPPTETTELDDTWLTHDLTAAPDHSAPDGSEVRLLGSFSRGGLAHHTLLPGSTSHPVRHRTVDEIRFVLDGHGELWRSPEGGQPDLVRLWPGRGVGLASGTAFQFRTTGAGPLRIATLTMPQWPGPSEAERLPLGHWPFAPDPDD